MHMSQKLYIQICQSQEYKLLDTSSAQSHTHQERVGMREIRGENLASSDCSGISNRVGRLSFLRRIDADRLSPCLLSSLLRNSVSRGLLEMEETFPLSSLTSSLLVATPPQPQKLCIKDDAFTPPLDPIELSSR